MKTQKVNEKYVVESLNEYYSKQSPNEHTTNVPTCEMEGLTYFVGNMTSEEFKSKMKSVDFEDFVWT